MRYLVRYYVTVTNPFGEVTVEARSEEEARRIVEEDFDLIELQEKTGSDETAVSVTAVERVLDA